MKKKIIAIDIKIKGVKTPTRNGQFEYVTKAIKCSYQLKKFKLLLSGTKSRQISCIFKISRFLLPKICMKQNSNIRLSGFILPFIVICFFIIRITGFQSSLFKAGDQFGYNSYLTTVFNNGNILDLSKANQNRSINARDSLVLPNGPKGKPVIKYTYGVSLLQLPFFLITWLIYRGTGYEMPYVISIYLSTFIYVLLGLTILIRFLVGFIKIKLAILTTFLLFFGTNLLYFTIIFPGMSHPYLFFLFSLLIYLIPKYYDSPNNKYAFYIGSMLGLILITRPVEAPVCLIFLLYGVSDLNCLRERMQFFKQHFHQLIIMLLSIILLVIPQFLYWKYATGQWFYDGYTGEGFDFSHPHIIDGLFSFKNGWFIYSPLLLIPIVYLARFSKKLKDFQWPILAYLIVTIYITYSWKDWNYNAGLGSRPMLEGYSFLIIPFGLFMMNLAQKRILKYLIFPFIIICLYLNILRTWQMQTGNFISEDANYTFNKNMAFRLTTTSEDLYAFDLNENQPESGHLKNLSKSGILDFENSNLLYIDSVFSHQGKKSERFTDELEFGEALNIPIPAGVKKGDYVKISFWAYVIQRVNHYQMGKMVVSFEKDGQSLLWKSIRIDNKLGATENSASLFGGATRVWKPVQYFVRMNIDNSSGVLLKIYGWNPGHSQFWIDDISAEFFRDDE